MDQHRTLSGTEVMECRHSCLSPGSRDQRYSEEGGLGIFGLERPSVGSSSSAPWTPSILASRQSGRRQPCPTENHAAAVSGRTIHSSAKFPAPWGA